MQVQHLGHDRLITCIFGGVFHIGHGDMKCRLMDAQGKFTSVSIGSQSRPSILPAGDGVKFILPMPDVETIEFWEKEALTSMAEDFRDQLAGDLKPSDVLARTPTSRLRPRRGESFLLSLCTRLDMNSACGHSPEDIHLCV